MSNIKYVAYLSKSDSGSALFRQHYEALAPQTKAEIKVLDFHQIKQHYGDKCPSWLKGYPVIATYSNEPTVWEGSKAIELVATWAKQRQAAAPAAPAAPAIASPAPAAAPQSVPEADFAPMGSSDFSRSCAVVSDDLYQSHMPYKGGSTGTSSNKVTSSEIAEYRSQRGGSS